MNDKTFLIRAGGIPVQVTRKRVKNVNLRVGRDGTACMSAPQNMPYDEIVRVAMDHVPWFRQNVEHARQTMATWPVEWRTGEELDVWGQRKVLEVREANEFPSCSVDGDTLRVVVPKGTTAAGRQAFVERWLAEELRRRVLELLPECERIVGRRATSITLRRMKSRWGSCTVSKGTIRINTALAEYPEGCLRTTLIHELCHLIERGHGPRFKALMDLYCPDWRVWQGWLDDHPSRA